MRTSPNGRKFITLEEGRARFDSKTGLYFPYRDQIGKWTIGVGHLIRPDEDFAMGITAERVDQLLMADLLKCEIAVDGIKAPVPLNQNQFDALVSWLINVGTGWASPEKSSVVRAIVNGQYDRVPELLCLYDVAGGKHQPFLLARRKREGKLWSTPVSEPLNEVFDMASHAASLRFGLIELARESDDEAREAEVEVVQDVWGNSDDLTPTVPGWDPKKTA